MHFFLLCQPIDNYTPERQGESISTQCCCLSQSRSQNQGLSCFAAPQARRESRTQKSCVSGSVLASSSTQAPHGCPSPIAILPSLPVWLNASLSCVHSKSGPVSCLLRCFWQHTNQNCFPPPFTIFLCCLELWRFGLPYPSVPSSNWIKLMGHQAAFEVRCADTQKYPKYTGIPSTSSTSCFSTFKEA